MNFKNTWLQIKYYFLDNNGWRKALHKEPTHCIFRDWSKVGLDEIQYYIDDDFIGLKYILSSRNEGEMYLLAYANNHLMKIMDLSKLKTRSLKHLIRKAPHFLKYVLTGVPEFKMDGALWSYVIRAYPEILLEDTGWVIWNNHHDRSVNVVAFDTKEPTKIHIGMAQLNIDKAISIMSRSGYNKEHVKYYSECIESIKRMNKC